METTKVKLTKEAFKALIDEVIYNTPKGISKYNDCEYFHVRCVPDSLMHKISIVYFGNPNDYVQQILDYVPDEYRNHITGFKKGGLWDDSYELTFDKRTQNKWNAQMQRTNQNYYNMYHNIH